MVGHAQWSAPLPYRRTLLHEGVDAFAGILGHHVAGHGLGRDVVGGAQIEVALPVEQALAGGDGDRRFAGDTGGQVGDGPVELADGHDPFTSP